MEKEIEKIKQERDEYLAGWKRAKADFANYKKEESERRQEWIDFASERLALNILPVLDSLERADKEMPEGKKENPEVQGVLQIIAQLREILKNQGVESFETVGKKFDPEFHEAVQEVQGEESGVVTEEVERGYTIRGKLLRPARVKVTK